MNCNYTKIGKRIKTERLNAGYKTQGAFAKAMGLSEYSRQTVAHWENGSKAPTLDELTKMCEIFKCHLGYLLCESDCKTLENAQINKVTGLDEKTIKILHNLNNNSYQDILTTLNKLLHQDEFFDLLCTLHTHINELNKNKLRYNADKIHVLSNLLNCSDKEAEKYIKSSSISLITSDFAKIIESIK